MNVFVRNPWACIFVVVSVLLAVVAIFKIDCWISSVVICSAELFILYNLITFALNCVRRKYKQAFLRLIALVVVLGEVIVVVKLSDDRYQDRLGSDPKEFKQHVERLEIM